MTVGFYNSTSKFVDHLEKQLRALKKVEPSARFLADSKARLRFQISLEARETWFKRILRKTGVVKPSPDFVKMARSRLRFRIQTARQPILGWFLHAKRLVASTLVMTLAVTSTLLFVDRNQFVSAAEPSFLEVVSGEVTVKHADRVIWDTVTKQVVLAPGDLIRLGDNASATIHFFDDSQLRLAENSTLLLSRMEVSPAFARQGMIEVALHQGKAWVQTLNVDDGHAEFLLSTRDALVSTQNASLSVESSLFDSTTVDVYRRSALVEVLRQGSEEVAASGKLSSGQSISVQAALPTQRNTELALLSPITEHVEADRETLWVGRNLEKDRDHLAELRTQALARLERTAGSLPGEVLYPVKRAKERLSLAFTSKENASIQLANERLSEAVVLFESGNAEKGKLALAEYQAHVAKLAEGAKSETVNTQVVTQHQRALVASLPGDGQIGIVKKVLNETEELLAEDPVEKVEIHLGNTLENISDVQDLVVAGDLESAQRLLANHSVMIDNLLAEADSALDDEAKKTLYEQVLEAQAEERTILAEINQDLANDSTSDLAHLVRMTNRRLDDQMKRTVIAIRPLLPDVVLDPVVSLPVEDKVYEFVHKVNIYKTYQGQKNQINRLFKKHPENARDLAFLTRLRDQLDTRAADLVNARILELENQLKASKARRVELKIDRARRERLKRVNQ